MELWMFYSSSLWPKLDDHQRLVEYKKPVEAIALFAVVLSEKFYNGGGILDETDDLKQVFLSLQAIKSTAIAVYLINRAMTMRLCG